MDLLGMYMDRPALGGIHPLRRWDVRGKRLVRMGEWIGCGEWMLWGQRLDPKLRATEGRLRWLENLIMGERVASEHPFVGLTHCSEVYDAGDGRIWLLAHDPYYGVDTPLDLMRLIGLVRNG